MPKKIFKWVAAARRPVTLEELREAIAVEPCQRSRNPESVLNDINQLIPCCRNLVTLDEEENLVQFAHHTIKIFLLEESNDPSLADFHFDLSHANFEAEEICVTYLSFEKLKLQLAREPKIAPLANPSSILRVSLAHGFDTKISSRLMSFVTRERRDLLRMQGRILDEAMDQRAVKYAATLQETYALLAYAGGHWIFHTQEFSIEKTKCWDLWRNLLQARMLLLRLPGLSMS